MVCGRVSLLLCMFVTLDWKLVLLGNVSYQLWVLVTHQFVDGLTICVPFLHRAVLTPLGNERDLRDVG